jgi:hypothetical protein
MAKSNIIDVIAAGNNIEEALRHATQAAAPFLGADRPAAPRLVGHIKSIREGKRARIHARVRFVVEEAPSTEERNP